jgi:hypothetical protein
MNRRLLQKNTRFLLIWLPVVLLVCSLAFYGILLKHAHHMQEKQLMLKQTNIWNAFTNKYGNIEMHVTAEYDIVKGNPITNEELNEPRDTTIYYTPKSKLLPFKKLTGSLQWQGENYLVTTYVSSTEFSHLIIKIFITEAVILALLLILL